MSQVYIGLPKEKLMNEHTIVDAGQKNPKYGCVHQYFVYPSTPKKQGIGDEFVKIHFQEGPVKEQGINGASESDLIAILIDRFESFQNGSHACSENQHTLTYLHGALGRLRDRTARREKAGTEGTSNGD
jgi:hypothetical protein